MKSSIIRKETFNAAHRLCIDGLTDEENIAIFGKCAYPHYHGHNYDLHVKVVGEINPKTGFVYDISVLKERINEDIIERFDHRNLNLDTVEFKDTIPTVENIAKVIYEILRPSIESQYDLYITLYETPRNYSQYPS